MQQQLTLLFLSRGYGHEFACLGPCVNYDTQTPWNGTETEKGSLYGVGGIQPFMA